MSTQASIPGPAPPAIPDHALIGLIARGSYGEVWLARNVLGVPRAVKIVYRQSFDEPRPFKRELAGIQKFEPISRSHEGLVPILHVGRSTSPDCFYYVMELADNADGETAPGSRFPVPGSTLAPPPAARGPGTTLNLEPGISNLALYSPKTLRSEIARRGRIPLDELLPLSLSLTSALGHLHRSGLVHRDLKPSNIIFVQGRPKIADIGLVSELGESRSFVGTEGFIPPEGPGTAAADLFGLGKVLYEASTGLDRVSFPEIPTEWLDQSGAKGLIEFHEVVLKACEGQADRRYQRAEDMHADLALLQSGKSIRHIHRMERRVALLRKAGLVASTMAVLALAAYWFAAREARSEREHARQLARSELQARSALQESLLMQARAGRHTGLSGCRFDSLEAIRRAAAGTNSLALRNEAIGCFALVDLRVLTNVLVERRDRGFFAFDPRLGHCLFRDRTGAYYAYRLSDGQETFVFRPSDTNAELPRAGANGSPRLAAGFLNDVRRFWELSRTIGYTWPTSNAPPHDHLQIAPDGGSLAVVTPRRTIDLYELTQGTLLRSLDVDIHRRPLSFSPDGRRLAVSLRGKDAVCILNWENGSTQATLVHPSGLVTLAWSAEGHTLATACFDRKIYLWDTETGQLRGALAGHQSRVTFLDFHPNGEVLASASWDSTIRLWDAATGQLLVTLLVGGKALRFSPDGRRLVFPTFTENRIVVCEVVADRVCRFLREVPPLQAQEPLNGPWCAEFSPDERLLVAATYDGVRLWDVGRAEQLARLVLGQCRSTHFRPPGNEFVVCSSGSGVQSWTVRADLGVGELALGPPRVLSAGLRDYGRACLSRDGQTLGYVHGSELTVCKEDGTVVQLPAGGAEETQVAMSPDGCWLAASIMGSGEIRLWNLISGQPVWTNRVEHGAHLAFAPDGRWLVSNSGADVCLWDVTSGRPSWCIPRPQPGELSSPVAISADGRLLAVAMTRKLVQLLDIATGREVATLESPVPRLFSWLAFSPSSTRLAVATHAHTIELWDLRKLRLQLAELGLDWDQPPYAAAPTHAPAGPIRIRIQR